MTVGGPSLVGVCVCVCTSWCAVVLVPHVLCNQQLLNKPFLRICIYTIRMLKLVSWENTVG